MLKLNPFKLTNYDLMSTTAGDQVEYEINEIVNAVNAEDFGHDMVLHADTVIELFSSGEYYKNIGVVQTQWKKPFISFYRPPKDHSHPKHEEYLIVIDDHVVVNIYTDMNKPTEYIAVILRRDEVDLNNWFELLV